MKRLGVLTLLVCACAGGAPIGGTGGGKGGGSGTGGSGGSSGTGGGGGIIIVDGLPLKNACATLNARRCDYFARCGLIEDTDDGKRDCAAWLLATWCGPTLWPARVEVGTLLYDAKVAQQCADAWSSGNPPRRCDLYEELPGVCTRFIAPNVAPLRACYDGYSECTEGTVCRGAACPRTCQALGAVGDTCQNDGDCRPLLYCKRTVQVTGAGTCTSFGAINNVCGPEEPCGAGLVCAGNKCVAPPTAGSPCATGGICDDTSWCQFGADGGTCSTKEGSGAPCTDDVQCMPGHLCQPGSGGAAAECTPRVIGALPSVCSDRQTCPPGTTCVGATATTLGYCEQPLTPGAPCIASDDCRKDLACASADGGFAMTCVTRQRNGGSCVLDRDCQMLSRCIGGVCTRLPVTGQSCAQEGACLFGPCSTLADGGATCADRYGPGTRCAFDGDCASNRCLGGMCLPACAP